VRAHVARPAQHEHTQRVRLVLCHVMTFSTYNTSYSNHPELVSVLSAAIAYIKRLLAAHSVKWATHLPPSSPTPLPISASVKLHQKGDHVAITEDVAIAVQNMSTLLMHETQHLLRSDCLSVMHSAPLFFTSLDSDPASLSPTTVCMPQSLNALASLYPFELVEGLLSTARAVPAAHTAPHEPSQRYEVGALVTAKCPVTKKFRVAKVVQVNDRSVLVQFVMPDQSTLRASFPAKFLRAVGHKTVPKGSEAAPVQQKAQVDGRQSTCAASRVPLKDDILSLCSLTLVPFMFQERHYRPLLTVLLQACSHKDAEFRALNAINSLVSTGNFVAHMTASESNWVLELGPLATILSSGSDSAHSNHHNVLKATVVSIFDSLLRGAATADQRRSFIHALVRARIVHALFQFCQIRDSPTAARDTAACVVLSCATVSPSPIAISWLRSSFREPRRSSSVDLLHAIAVSWSVARENSDDDFDEDRCVLSVERYNLIASSVKSFGFCTLQGLSKRLKVNFVLERGCDAGGLTVEWLHLLLDTVFSDFAFFLPVLLPNGQSSGVVRVNHSASFATTLPVVEVFRMVGCCLALCLQVRDCTRIFPNVCDRLSTVEAISEQPLVFSAFCFEVYYACSLDCS
jgi:hypothetical protein